MVVNLFQAAPQANEEIYYFFNGKEVKFSSIDCSHLPKFLHKNGDINLNNTYIAKWLEFNDAHNHLWKYFILEIQLKKYQDEKMPPGGTVFHEFSNDLVK